MSGFITQKSSFEKGLSAESAAATELRAKGYDILDMRYKTPYGEIDIIARDGDIYVAVEVKFRPTIESALEAVTHKAQMRIARAFTAYIASLDLSLEPAMRFDVIAITPPLSIHHIENAWFTPI